ncbi:type II secretion system protein [bacterium]|nr:type II secretion system protein [bacterium]
MSPIQRSRGFSLIELLVVIGVITILTAIVLPLIPVGYLSSRRSACLSNLQQIGRAIVTYAGNHSFHFPAPAHADTAEAGHDPLNDEKYWDGHKVGDEYVSYTWKGKLYAYMGGRADMTEDEVYKVMKCPSVRYFNGHKGFYGANAYVTMHYGTPETLLRAGRKKALHFDQIESPSTTFMIGENNTGHWAVRPEAPRSPTDFTPATAAATLYARHGGKANWVFFDGSARMLTKAEAQEQKCRLWLDIK